MNRKHILLLFLSGGLVTSSFSQPKTSLPQEIIPATRATKASAASTPAPKKEQPIVAPNHEATPANNDNPFAFSKPKAKKAAPDSIVKKAEKTTFALTQKQKRQADSVKKAQTALTELAQKFPNLPKGATFCGERVPVEDQNVAQRFHDIFSRMLNARGVISYYMRVSNRYSTELRQAMRRNGLPNDLFYLACAESGFANLTSSKGAKGFFQFMEETARDYNLEVSYTVDERLHPQKSAEAACRFLKDLHRALGRWSLAAAAYNMGQGAIEATTSSQGTKDYFRLALNHETGEYVYRILSIKLLMENPKAYGVAIPSRNQPIPYITEKVQDYHIYNLREFAADCDVDYATLKTLNPWLVRDQLWVQKGKVYEIRLPKFSNQVISADELIPLPYIAPYSSISKSFVRDSIKAAYLQEPPHKHILEPTDTAMDMATSQADGWGF